MQQQQQDPHHLVKVAVEGMSQKLIHKGASQAQLNPNADPLNTTAVLNKVCCPCCVPCLDRSEKISSSTLFKVIIIFLTIVATILSSIVKVIAVAVPDPVEPAPSNTTVIPAASVTPQVSTAVTAAFNYFTTYTVELNAVAAATNGTAEAEEAVRIGFSVVLIIIYMAIMLLFIVEIILRIVGARFVWFFIEKDTLTPNFANICEVIIIILELVLDAVALGFSINNGTVNSAFGSVITLRLLVMMTKVKGLKEIVHGVKRAIGTIILLFFFLAIMLYAFSLMAFVLYAPSILPVNKKCAICAERFYSLEKSFYTMFQVVTGDSWAEGIVLPLVAQSWLGRVSFIFFIFFICVSVYVLLNVLTAVIVEGVVDDDEDEEYLTEEEIAELQKKKKKNLLEKIQKVFKRIKKSGKATLAGNTDVVDSHLIGLIEDNKLSRKKQDLKKEKEYKQKMEKNIMQMLVRQEEIAKEMQDLQHKLAKLLKRAEKHADKQEEVFKKQKEEIDDLLKNVGDEDEYDKKKEKKEKKKKKSKNDSSSDDE